MIQIILLLDHGTKIDGFVMGEEVGVLVVVVDPERNLMTTSEEIPPIPEPEYRFLCGEILKLLHPNVVSMDQMKVGSFSEQGSRGGSRPWGEDHDLHLRVDIPKENTATHIFSSQDFLKKRSRSTNQPPDPTISQFLDSQGFLDYLERGLGSEENGNGEFGTQVETRCTNNCEYLGGSVNCDAYHMTDPRSDGLGVLSWRILVSMEL
ncbi:Scytalone dehydratase [Orobanche hederae]